ncbi:MAG: hypothetical protein LBS69_04380 [Prevotellaceae bacterium]|jgi:hypothetical protein|nr:hypothetical protein [Prevotellaceae bacterium]
MAAIQENISTATRIENILGPKKDRYCSNGFRNVRFSFANIAFSDSVLNGNVCVDFSKKWSSKKDDRQMPHLGTTEYVSISILLTELYLRLSMGFGSRDIAVSWVKQVRLKSMPEINRESIQPFHIRKQNEDDRQSAFKIVIGHMLMYVIIAHPLKHVQTVDPYFNFADYLCGLHKNFHYNGYREINHDVHNVQINPVGYEASGDILLQPAMNKFNGIGSAYYPTMDIASFILVSGQLIQALLYNLDNMRREDSGNMWLRSLDIRYPSPLPPDNLTEHIRCETFKKIPLKGQIWRVADIAMCMGNIEATFNMTHQIQ